MSIFKKALNYLGLGPEDAYDDYDLPVDGDMRQPVRAARPGFGDGIESGAVRTISPRPAVARDRESLSPRSAEHDAPVVRRQPSSIRTVSPANSSRPYTVRPRRFDQAQEVADRFREGQAVIVNLEGIERDLSRRLIDFASGLCYGLEGAMEKVGSGVYLLTPANVSVSPEDRRLIGENDDD